MFCSVPSDRRAPRRDLGLPVNETDVYYLHRMKKWPIGKYGTLLIAQQAPVRQSRRRDHARLLLPDLSPHSARGDPAKLDPRAPAPSWSKKAAPGSRSKG